MSRNQDSINWRKIQGEAILKNQSKRKPILCSNGIEVKSSHEKRITEYLLMHNIDFEYEKELTIGGKTYYPDFYLKNHDSYIEFFGWNHIPSYKAKTDEKIDMYKKHNIKCIYLYLKGSSDLEKILEEEIKKIKR